MLDKNKKLKNGGKSDTIDAIFRKYAEELFDNCKSVDDCKNSYNDMIKVLGAKCTKRIEQLENLKKEYF